MDSIVFLGLTLSAWITIVTVVALFLVLLLTKISEDIAFLGAMAVLGLSGVLSEKEVLAGFSTSSVVLVAVLFIVVAGLIHTGVIRWIMQHFLGTPRNYPASIVRLMAPVAALSSVLSNTTVVALFVQVVKNWAKKLGIAPSKLLIPLSYAAGMGGLCTLIGTPPNLIISGLYSQDGGQAMGFFTPTIPGLFCLVVGVLAVLAMRKLLPERKSPEDAFQQTSDYTVELLVPADHPHIGDTLEEAGLIDVRGGKLIELVRFDHDILSPVRPDEILMGGDRLIYAGEIDQILALRKHRGLVIADQPVFHVDELDKRRKLRTAFVQKGCDLLRGPVSSSTFEHDHKLTLVAVARQGKQLLQSPRDSKLRVGDLLLLECAPGSKGQEIKGLQFCDDSEIMPEAGVRTIISTLILIAMVLLSTFKVLTLLQSAVVAAAAMLVFRCCSPTQAMKSIDWNILMIFAGSVVIGNAIEKSGVATVLANELMGICHGKPLLVMIAMSLTATFVTEFISNTAAGAIFFPIVFQAAESMGCNPMPFLISLMIAVSSSFATPIGSPTHLLVYGPGGYRFTDFMKIGIPMNFIILAANIFIVNLIYPLAG